jgi:hypothetical protein
MTLIIGSTKIIPNTTLEINGNIEGTFAAGSTIDVQITDGTNPVTPDDISISGNTVTIEIPDPIVVSSLTCAQLNSDLTGAQRQVIQRVLTVKTGQITSYRTGDDGNLQIGRGASFTTLDCDNPFGNNNRFTDQLGGQTYSDNIVVDWLTGLMWYRVLPTSLVDWNDAIDAANAATTGGYTDWFLPNRNQFSSIYNDSTAQPFNYAPINITVSAPAANRTIWTSTTVNGSTTSAYTALNGLGTLKGILTSLKTNTHQYIYCRVFNFSGGTFS